MPIRLYNISLVDTLAVGTVKILLSTEVEDPFIIDPVNEQHTLIKLGEISIGNDNESDLVYFPSNFDVELRIDGTDSLFNQRLLFLSKQKTYVDLKVNNTSVWAGYVDKESVIGNKTSKKIKLTCYDQSLKLKETEVTSSILGLSEDTPYLLNQLLLDLLTNTTINHYPFITSLNYLGSVQLRYDHGSGYVNYNFDNLYVKPKVYFDSTNNQKNVAVLIKNICANFNCIGYFGMDRVFHIVPRVYEGQSVVTISKLDLLKDPEYKLSFGKKGFRANLFRGFYPQNDPVNFYVFERGWVDSNSEVEDMYIYLPGGFFQPDFAGANSGFHIYYNGVFYNALVLDDTIKQWRMKLTNGNYSDWEVLWRLICNKAIEYTTIVTRYKVELEVSGHWNKWKPQQFYKLDSSNDVYRIIKASYNLEKDKSKLIMKKSN